MLTLEALAEADKYVKLFYEELERTPRTDNGFKEHIPYGMSSERWEKEWATRLGMSRFGLERISKRIPLMMYIKLE